MKKILFLALTFLSFGILCHAELIPKEKLPKNILSIYEGYDFKGKIEQESYFWRFDTKKWSSSALELISKNDGKAEASFDLTTTDRVPFYLLYSLRQEENVNDMGKYCLTFIFIYDGGWTSHEVGDLSAYYYRPAWVTTVKENFAPVSRDGIERLLIFSSRSGSSLTEKYELRIVPKNQKEKANKSE